MHVSPYLTFDGRCEEALRFYEACLGGKIGMVMTYGDSPMAEMAPPGWAKKILHASLSVGGQELTPDEFYALILAADMGVNFYARENNPGLTTY